MTREQLERLTGAVIGPPVDDVALAVADALLPVPLPPALRAFLMLCNGARAGGVEVFDADRITEATNDGGHSWQLSTAAVVIGTAGDGRALVMIDGRDEVCEVDDDPWDVRTMELAADSPLDLFVHHRGTPLRDRAPWAVLPALSTAIGQARASLARDVDALLNVGIASLAGEPLPPSLHGFRQVAVPRAWQKLSSDEYETFLVNYRPPPPASGPMAAREWQKACDAIISGDLRDRLRTAPVPEAITALDPIGDDALSTADIVRGLAWLVLLAKAREDLADLVGADAGASPGQRLSRAFLAGHVPVSLESAI